MLQINGFQLKCIRSLEIYVIFAAFGFAKKTFGFVGFASIKGKNHSNTLFYVFFVSVLIIRFYMCRGMMPLNIASGLENAFPLRPSGKKLHVEDLKIVCFLGEINLCLEDSICKCICTKWNQDLITDCSCV